jgi:Fe-S-cluster containining protein
MSQNSDDTPENVTATVEFNLSGKPLRLEVSVPTGPTRPSRMLPLFRSLAGVVVDAAVESVRAEGLAVSCKKGCGACCRQLVPVSHAEARDLRDRVENMPEPRRSELRRGFENAEQRLKEAGIFDKLSDPARITAEELMPLGLQYFHLGIACPFLEDESCSIHPERPVACREYLVTSPAENCTRPTPETVKMVKLPAQVSRAARSVSSDRGAPPNSWIPLSLAPGWADAHPEEPAARPGPDLVRDFFSRFSGKDIPTHEG